MAGFRIRDKYGAQVVGSLWGFVAGLVIDYTGVTGLTGDLSMLFVLGFALAVGFACRWGWELRRWYRKTRPGHDPLASLRPKN